MRQAMNTNAKTRLDQALVARHFYPARARARDAVLRGTVLVNGVVATKPALEITHHDVIEIKDDAARFVSRAALKLVAALDHFNLDPAGKICLDIGASTGGFTQVLIERSAAKVHAIDVGHGQLHPRIAQNPRVKSTEGLNARELTLDDIDYEEPEFIVCDASFISLKLVLPPALELAVEGAFGVFLIKPQFEVGKDGIAKDGQLKNPEDGPRMAQELEHWLNTETQWRSLGVAPSPLEGGDGTQEYLLAAQKQIEEDE
jgi:23S rRNA (cytidine1920-2'-O)/16S rRNA (cytidine1409-2'-O)-methyltransferase